MSEKQKPKIKPGVCVPWEQKLKELPPSAFLREKEGGGEEQLVQKVWEDIDALGYLYIWQCLLSF